MALATPVHIPCNHSFLRPLRREDKDALVKYANNIKIWRNVRDIFPFPYTPRDADVFIDHCQRQHQVTTFCIDYKDECIGMIGYIPQTDVYRFSAEIGYWLGEPCWGKGLMTDAVKGLVAYIFSNSDIVRLFAGVFEWNRASMRVLEKAGFVQDGLFEKAIFKEGHLVNEHRFSLLRPGLHS